MIVQPTIVDSSKGRVIVNPSIVVAPAIVSTPSGEKVMIKPDVTVLKTPVQNAPELVNAPVPNDPKLVNAPVPNDPELVIAPVLNAPELVNAPVPNAAQNGCYPIRRYDMSKINAYEYGISYSDI
jgi:hypothetical protein